LLVALWNWIKYGSPIFYFFVVPAASFIYPRASERRHFGRRNMGWKNKPRRRRHFLLTAGQIIGIEWYVEAVLSLFSSILFIID
jgi:hypothetical protein